MGSPQLHKAAITDQVAAMDCLVSKDADIKIQDDESTTAIAIASQQWEQ